MTQRGNEERNRIGGERPRGYEISERNGWCHGVGGCVTHRIVAQVEAEGDARVQRTDG